MRLTRRLLQLTVTIPFAATSLAGPIGAAEEPAAVGQVIWVEGEADPTPPPTSVATRMPVPIEKTPASVSVVSGATLREQGATHLGDALANVAGVSVHTGFGVHDFFSMRGVDSLTGGLVLTDGEGEPEATFYHTYNLERVEVLKGPGGFLYGSNALVGAVNLVRKQPLFENSAQLHFGAASYETYRGSADIALADVNRGVAFRLNALYDDSAGWRDGKDSRAIAVNPAMTFRLGDDASLTLNAEYVRNEYAPDSGLPIAAGAVADVPRERSYDSPYDDNQQDVLRLRADYTQRFCDGFTLRNKLYASRLDWQSDGTLLSGVVPAAALGLPGGDLVLRAQLQLDDDQRLFGDRLEGLFSFGGDNAPRHELLVGLELQRYSDAFQLDVGLLPPIDLATPVETVTGAVPATPGLGTTADARNIMLAPYIVDRIAVSDRLAVWIGGRYDHLDYEDDANGIARTDDEWSPLLALMVTPRPGLQLYASHGRSFAVPSTRVVDERRPEDSRQVEVGLKGQTPDGRLRADVAYYHLERGDVAVPDRTGVTETTGSERARGVEVDLVARPGAGLSAHLAYAYTDAEFTDFGEAIATGLDPRDVAVVDRTGNAPTFTPDHTLRVSLSKGFASGLGIAAGARYLSKQFIAPDNAYAIDGYVTFDAALSYTHGGWHGSLHFENLTDEEYDTRGFGSSSVIPGRPLTVAGNLYYSF